jgi:hypothetical protein
MATAAGGRRQISLPSRARLAPAAKRRHATCRATVGGVSVLGLDHVQMAAPPGCELQARRFYGELIGLAELAKPEPLRGRGGVWFSVGAQQLHIAVEESFTPARRAHPALRVEPHALDTLAERLVTADATVEWDDALPGVRRFYTHDPWGNRVELLAEDMNTISEANVQPARA